ncbi:MAG TPA: DMT family transporter [Longimicrobiaceae bacterium]|nr:DMT family transporter [Longimicrobiaceae bacterium]
MSRGIRYMVAGAFFFSVMSLLVKLVGARIPGQEIVLVRGSVTLVITFAMLKRAGIRARGSREGFLVLRALLGFAALSCFYYSVINLPLADATLIQYTNPVWTALLAAWLLGERMGRREALLIAASLGGVVLIARPSFIFGSAAGRLDPAVVAIALIGALFSAAAYVTVRKLGQTEHALVIVFYFTLITVPAAIPGALMEPVWPTLTEWAILLAVGLTAQAGQVYLTKGLQMEPAGRATAVGYLQIVFAAGWGMIFFAEFPDGWSILGALIIVGSTLGLARHRAAVGAPAVGTAR